MAIKNAFIRKGFRAFKLFNKKFRKVRKKTGKKISKAKLQKSQARRRKFAIGAASVGGGTAAGFAISRRGQKSSRR